MFRCIIFIHGNLTCNSDVVYRGKFSSMQRALKDCVYNIYISYKDLEKFSICPAYMQVRYIENGIHKISYFISKYK